MLPDETALKDNPRCHVLRLVVRHGDLEWHDGERSLEELFAMVDASGKVAKHISTFHWFYDRFIYRAC